MKKPLLLLAALLVSVATYAQLCSFTANTGSPNVGIFTPSGAFPNAACTWSFGDGMMGTSFGPIAHTYVNGGAYTVCLNVLDSIGNVQCTFCDSVLIQSSLNCTFTTFVTPGSLIVDFLVSVPPGTYASWDYGDMTTGTGGNPWHGYTSPGTYTVCVDIIDSTTLVSTCHSCQSVSVGGTNNCYFAAFPDSMNTMQYHFYGSPSYSSSTLAWDFGDGSTGTGSNPLHQYAAAGTYFVCMNELNPNGVNVCHYCDSITVTSGGGSMSCNFSYTISPNTNPVLVTAVAAISGPAPYFVHWDFGNGQTTTGMAGTAQYLTSGVYTITMTVTDGLGTILCSSTQVVVINLPVSSCTSYFVSSTAGLSASFIDLSSGISPSTAFSWSFGDGTSSNVRFPQHTYTTPGMYTVCLTISDNGCSDQYCAMVLADTNTVNPGPCQANFVTLQAAPYSVLIVDLSTGSNLSYLWDFGDGTTSTQQYPSHYYSTTGSYVVCLTVNDGLLGCSSTFCDTLTVDSMGNVLRSTMTGFTINVVSPGMLTGTTSIETQERIVLYPNPASDRIIVSRSQSSSAAYRILDLRGAVLLTGMLNEANVAIPVSSLSTGVYVLETTLPGRPASYERFMKH
ncbi:MAG: hypothetical protein RL021_2122 [Bacteroidota bacterium]